MLEGVYVVLERQLRRLSRFRRLSRSRRLRRQLSRLRRQLITISLIARKGKLDI